jgi:hypothetical protein
LLCFYRAIELLKLMAFNAVCFENNEEIWWIICSDWEFWKKSEMNCVGKSVQICWTKLEIKEPLKQG